MHWVTYNEKVKIYSRALLLSLVTVLTFAQIAQPMGAAAAKSAPLTYRVSDIATLSEISTYLYGTKNRWQEIAEANQMQAPYALTKGQVLKLKKAPTLTPEEGDATIARLRMRQKKTIPTETTELAPNPATSPAPPPAPVASAAPSEPKPPAMPTAEISPKRFQKKFWAFVGIGGASYSYEEARLGKLKGTQLSARGDFSYFFPKSRWDAGATSEWNVLPLSSDAKPSQFRSINANASFGYLLTSPQCPWRLRARAGLYFAWGAVNTNTSDYRQIGPELYPQLSYEWNPRKVLALTFRFSPVFTDTLKVLSLAHHAIRSELSYMTGAPGWNQNLRLFLTHTAIEFDLDGSSVSTTQWGAGVALGF